MAEIKYQFDGISKMTSLLLFNAMASGPWFFLTQGMLGRFTMFLLKKFSKWALNQGLVIVNIGIDIIEIEMDKRAFDDAMEQAIKKVQSKRKLTPGEIKAIDADVKKAFKEFVRFV